jgi:hypothetical protein
MPGGKPGKPGRLGRESSPAAAGAVGAEAWAELRARPHMARSVWPFMLRWWLATSMARSASSRLFAGRQ